MSGVPTSLEGLVLAVIGNASKSREELEATTPEAIGPLDDIRVMLHNWTSILHSQGMPLALLSMATETRAELLKRMPGLVDAAPAWLEAQVRGDEPLTARLFGQGLAQTLAIPRLDFERVIREQANDPETIERILTEAPVPPPIRRKRSAT